MNENFNLSDFIRDRRIELDLTTRELAEKVGVSAATVTKWENGNIKHLREDKLRPLAVALNVHPLALFGYTDISTGKHYTPTEVKRIPMYSKTDPENFFTNSNILKYISTDINADFAITATRSHEDVIRPHDILLFSKSATDLHNKYVLLLDQKSSEHPFIDKLLLVHNNLFRYDNTKYSILPDNLKIMGVLVEIRRLP